MGKAGGNMPREEARENDYYSIALAKAAARVLLMHLPFVTYHCCRIPMASDISRKGGKIAEVLLILPCHVAGTCGCITILCLW